MSLPKRIIFLLLSLFTLSTTSLARADTSQAGDLDTSFGIGGVSQFTYNGPFGMGMVLQQDGKIIVYGGRTPNQFALARFELDGGPDPSFGMGGWTFTDFPEGIYDFVSSVVVLPDGKIVAAGTIGSDFAVARYLPNGTLDASFGEQGKVLVDFRESEYGAMLVSQLDGKLLLVGTTWTESEEYHTAIAMARLLPDGQLDLTFKNNGKTIIYSMDSVEPSALLLQPDGRYLVAGVFSPRFNQTAFIARYNPDGSPDATFDDDGILLYGAGDVYSVPLSVPLMVLAPDGKIIAFCKCSSSYGSPQLLRIDRFNPDGSPDLSFDAQESASRISNQVHINSINAALLQKDGKLVLVGSAGDWSDFMLIRLMSDGSLDSTFGEEGLILKDLGQWENVQAAAKYPDERIILAGFSGDTDILIRFLNDVPYSYHQVWFPIFSK